MRSPKLPALPDEKYLYKEITEEDANNQGVYTHFEDGVEVPYSGKTISELMLKPSTRPLDAKPKADGQPATKAPAAAKEGGAMPQMPRHPAGLLGAAEAIEESGVATPDSDSNAPTPPAEPADEAAPEIIEQRVASGAATPEDGPELPLPRGATDPDDYGVCLISRRPTRLELPNNRIMMPNLFEWDDLDIGFRDSTNCAQKGATKQRRGKYLGKPGSNYLFIDRRAGIWDSTLCEGELDEELVKKHKLHPTLGLVLPGSVNEWEPPKPIVSGWKPVVFVTPNGDLIHTSRSIEAVRKERDAQDVERRGHLAQLLRAACEEEEISMEEISPDAEVIESNRTEMLVGRGIDPAQVARPERPPPSPEPVEEDTTGFDQFTGDALAAAAAIEAEEEAARVATSRRVQPARQPYDAIRDVFTDNAPARPPSPPAVHEAPVSMVVDTAHLSVLAEAALLPEPAPAIHPTAVEAAHYHQPPPNGVMRLGDYEQPQSEYPPPPADYPRYPEPRHFAGQEEYARANSNFLRTALNPSPPPSMPPMQEYSGVPVTFASGPVSTQAPQAAAGRTPFSNTGAAKALPALRPMRNMLTEPPTSSELQGSPALHHGTMVASNSGAYFPPAASRPFHNGYSLQQDQMQPMQPMMPQQPLPNSLQAPSLAYPPMGPAPHPQMGTPPPHHQPVGPPPGPQMGAQPPIHFQTQQQPLAPATGPALRSRAGSASAASAQASSKYRKLEPAPTPPHRMSYAGNGQELRTVQFDYREAIKDYTPIEAPPRHGPTQIRGWTHNNIRKTAATTRPTSSSSKGDTSGNTHPNTGPNSDESFA